MSSPDTSEITYQFTHEGQPGRTVSISLELDRETLAHRHPLSGELPNWTRLEFFQCKGCPLTQETQAHCPAAVSLVDMVDEFRELLSYTQVETRVVTEQREYFRKTTVQRALSSLIGLSMATSGCPILAKFRPMARFHLPFSTREETMFRAAGAYLIAQYYLKKRGEPAELGFDGLRKLYGDIHTINMSLAERLRAASTPDADANVNALVILDLFTQDLPISFKEDLRDLEHLFEPFLTP
ncbi:MAG: hypothetical protein KJ052_07935 [Candidatus Hydrogenedentes bacterium]|nr:hypothetical protein [Candidatus Hydrogenedentota bacterium]